MSRSYKKVPTIKCAPCDGTYGKNQANRRVRRFKGELASGGAYRKLYCTWDIHDYVWSYTLNEWLAKRAYSLAYDEMRGWESDPNELNLNKCINKWKKEFYWK